MTTGSFGHVEPRDGIQRVEIGAHHTFEIGWRIFRHVDEHVHRALAKFLAGLDVGELLAGDVHRQQRIEVNIGVHRDGVGLLFGDGGWCLGQCHRRNRRAEAERQC